MRALPDGIKAYKRTATFTESTLPAGLQGEHRTRTGVWGVIRVLSGEVLYRILGEPIEEHLLRLDAPGIVEPAVPHQLELRGPVKLYVEFCRSAD